MNDPLHNPVYEALRSGDAGLNRGTHTAAFFDEAVSPFAGFDESNIGGFAQLYALLPPGRKILYANPTPVVVPNGWALLVHVPGVQMIYTGSDAPLPEPLQPVPLGEEQVPQMIALAALTKPGPFGNRTIDFGHYHGFFDGKELVAMTGQRLHVQHYTEISAVCTHPGQLGKGYASALVQHQVNLIRRQGQIPFLHVREDNQRAIAVYERIGFRISRPMQFYFLRKSGGANTSSSS